MLINKIHAVQSWENKSEKENKKKEEANNKVFAFYSALSIKYLLSISLYSLSLSVLLAIETIYLLLSKIEYDRWKE